MSDLSERLDWFIGRFDCPDGVVEDARDRILELETALEPFARYGHVIRGQRANGERAIVELWGEKITGNHFSAAYAALPLPEVWRSTGQHTHQGPADTCGKCGLDIRDSIHAPLQLGEADE